MIAGDIAGVIDDFFTAGYAFAFSFFVKPFLVTACVLGRIRQTIHRWALHCFLFTINQNKSYKRPT